MRDGDRLRWRRRRIGWWLGLAAWVLAVRGAEAAAAEKPLPFVRTQGTLVVDDQGNRLTLRGCNLGNWLILESWMLGWNFPDQYTLEQVWADRFGAAEAQRLMEQYREGYVRQRDLERVKSFGFNLVRVPFNYRLLMDETGAMRPDAFKWLDRAVALCEEAGVYCILDLHGPPGGQSTADHTGHANQNKLWSDPAAQQRMVELWRRVADRYKDRSAIAGYDLLNEPYADFKTDVRRQIHDISLRCYRAIRSTGDQHVVILPNALGQGVSFHGDVKAEGLEQFAFTDHYYPGLFGSPSTVESHARTFARTIPTAQAYLDRAGGPMLIGEFNVVLEKAGGKPVMRKYYDEFARRGWMATMWSYKLLKPAPGVQPDNWYMVTNAEPLPPIDIHKSDLETVRKYVASLAEMPLVADERLRTALTSSAPPEFPMPGAPALPESAPANRAAGKWRMLDVDCPAPGGLEELNGAIRVTAAGHDIFSTRDSFGFVQQPAGETATLVATLDDLVDSDQWAKAGLMIRFGDPSSADYAAAPFVMLNAFPDGSVATVAREKAGAPAHETKRVVGPLPYRLALMKSGAGFETYVQGPAGWIKLGEGKLNATGKPRIGLAVCSHAGQLYTSATFSAIELSGQLPRPTIRTGTSTTTNAGPNLLKNGSFQKPGQGDAPPAGWNHWGQPVVRTETGVRMENNADPGDVGLWQDVTVRPAKRYEASVHVRRMRTEGTVTLALEAPAPGGQQITLAERTYDLSQFATDGPLKLQLTAVAPAPKMRLLLRVGGKSGAAEVNGGFLRETEE